MNELKLLDTPVEAIIAEGRSRRDMGDIATLAASIERVGLLHPIVALADGTLVAGERRLQAVKLLGWNTVPVRIVDIDAIVIGEHDENEFRKDFTPSERVEIGRRVEAKLGERRGGDTSKGEQRNVQNFGECKGKKTDAIAAQKAGFGNAETYRQAKTVVDRGAPELVEAMDRGDVSVSAAAEVATMPPQQQSEIVARGEDEIIKEAARIRRERKEEKKAEREAIKRAVPDDLPRFSERFRLIHSDLRDADIKPESVDCIITDPPYPEEYLDCFKWLADSAATWLKTGGTLAVMSGQAHLPQVIANLCSNRALSYRWTMAYLTPGGQAVQVFPRKVNTFWKPIVVLTKGSGGDWIGDVCKSDVNNNDKRFHHWGQSESGMANLIDRLSIPGQVVCDPFLGGGTTGVVSVQMSRLFVGCDIDENNIKISASRLQEIIDAA